MFDKVRDGTIPMRAWASLKVLFMGYAAGIVLAAIFTILALRDQVAPPTLNLDNPDHEAQGIDLAASTPEAFANLIKTEVPRWRKIVKDAGAKVD